MALYVFAKVNQVYDDVGSVYLYNNTINTFVEYFLMVSIPACTVKQIVNVSQLCSSCYAVAEHDAKEKNK